MKTDALKNSITVAAIIMPVVTAIIFNPPQSLENYIKEPIVKIGLVIIGVSGFLISISYGIQYRRILKYQEAREARLEELEKIIEDGNYFAIQTIRYGLKLIKNKKLKVSDNWIRLDILERVSSSNMFKLVTMVLIILWALFFIALVKILYF